MPNRLKLCTCALLLLDFVVILARSIGLVLVNTLARILLAAKTPILALTVTHRKFVVSKIRMTDLSGLNPWSRILVWPSPDYQPGEEGLIDERGAAVHTKMSMAQPCRDTSGGWDPNPISHLPRPMFVSAEPT